jgi:hypothetical protein
LHLEAHPVKATSTNCPGRLAHLPADAKTAEKRPELPPRLRAFVNRLLRAELWPVALEQAEVFCPAAPAPATSSGRFGTTTFSITCRPDEGGMTIDLVGVPAARVIGVLLAGLPPPKNMQEPLRPELVRPSVAFLVEAVSDEHARFRVPAGEQKVIERALARGQRWLLQVDRF